MKAVNHTTAIGFFLTASCVSAAEKPSAELLTIQEAYKAAIDNLISGSGTGVYEIYTAPAGKGSKMELKIKAKANISFSHGSFHIRLDYEKDDIHHMKSRVIVYDGTALLVNRMSNRIQPVQSEGNVYEAKPTLRVMRMAGFDYNPCSLPSSILPIDKLPRIAESLIVKSDANMDYLGTLNIILGTRPILRGSFLASSKAGYNVINYRQYNKKYNDFLILNLQATWERKNAVWYVKSIDRQDNLIDGSAERMVLRYETFEPNAEVSPSLFKFDSLALKPTARVLDRRPNAEELVLIQPQASTVDIAKLDTLADAVKGLTPSSAHPQPPKLHRHYLLITGALLCLLGLLLFWRKRARKGGVTPNP